MSLEARAAGLRRMLEEALELLRKGDAVQGAEKLYKVAEDAVKALSELRGLPEHEEAARKGRWQARLLHEAARRLAEIYGGEVLDAWEAAYEFHVEGFHEERLAPDYVMGEAYKVEGLVRLVEEEARRLAQRQGA